MLRCEAENDMIGTFWRGDSAVEQGAAERKGQTVHAPDAAGGRHSPLEEVTWDKDAHPDEAADGPAETPPSHEGRSVPLSLRALTFGARVGRRCPRHT